MRKILSLALLLSMPLLAKNNIDIDISAAINDTNLKNLADNCNWNKGDYEACLTLKDTLSAKCDERNFESCGALGILLIYLRREEDATKALNKACDAGLLNFCLNAGMHDLYYTGNIKRAFVNLKKVCDATIEPSKKKLACKMSYGLKPCLNDNECNPVKKAKELLDQD